MMISGFGYIKINGKEVQFKDFPDIIEKIKVNNAELLIDHNDIFYSTSANLFKTIISSFSTIKTRRYSIEHSTPFKEGKRYLHYDINSITIYPEDGVYFSNYCNLEDNSLEDDSLEQIQVTITHNLDVVSVINLGIYRRVNGTFCIDNMSNFDRQLVQYYFKPSDSGINTLFWYKKAAKNVALLHNAFPKITYEDDYIVYSV